MGTISGTVKDVNGDPAPGRIVRAYRRDSGELLDEVLTGGRWTPSEINPSIFLDDKSIITEESGAVSVWSDRSGNSHHYSQTSAGFRPIAINNAINGKRVLRFDGVDDRLFSISAQTVLRSVSNAWIFSIVKKRGSDDSGGVPPNRVMVQFNRGDFSSRLSFGVSNFTASKSDFPYLSVRPVDDNSSSEITYAVEPVHGRFVMLSAYWSGSGNFISLGVDGAPPYVKTPLSTASSTSNTIPHSSGPSHIGCSASGLPGSGINYTSFSDVDLAALIVGSGSLPSNDDKQRLEGWAAWYYGLQENLPDDHTYKTTPPVIDSSSGDYLIDTGAYEGEVNVICLDDDTGTLENDLIHRAFPV